MRPAPQGADEAVTAAAAMLVMGGVRAEAGRERRTRIIREGKAGKIRRQTVVSRKLI